MAAHFVKNSVLVKCGGFSSHLAKLIGEEFDHHPLWSAHVDAHNPLGVLMTHLDFLENGAEIILSNTYQSSVEGFEKYLKYSREESIYLMRKSVQLAKKAKEAYIDKMEKTNGNLDTSLPLVLASIGPYGAHFHDGSEYTGNYAENVSSTELQEWHRTRIDACLEEGVDGLAIETIPCQVEAEAVVDMILKDYPGVNFWVSFQCKDDKTLAHGENFHDAVLSIWNRVKASNATDRLFGIGVNCVNPRFVTPLLQSVCSRQKEAIPFVVYSNSGETYDVTTSQWVGAEDVVPLETYVPTWIELGARIIGGCCRVYGADIHRIRKCIDKLRISK